MRGLGSGDTTSRVDESVKPEAYPWEKQRNVNFFHTVYLIFFSWQDRIIEILAGKGSKNLKFELTVSSILGFGMQSWIILALAVTDNLNYLPELILGMNMILLTSVLLRSRL